jgi:hypothetical protein
LLAFAVLVFGPTGGAARDRIIVPAQGDGRQCRPRHRLDLTVAVTPRSERDALGNAFQSLVGACAV